MASTETLSIRLSPQTRRILADAALTQDAAGASALAREIIERWAAETVAKQIRADIDRATTYIQTHSQGWTDDPDSFFTHDLEL